MTLQILTRARTSDYAYCLDHGITFDYWRYETLLTAGHEKCRVRNPTKEELPELTKGFDDKYLKHERLPKIYSVAIAQFSLGRWNVGSQTSEGMYYLVKFWAEKNDYSCSCTLMCRKDDSKYPDHPCNHIKDTIRRFGDMRRKE